MKIGLITFILLFTLFINVCSAFTIKVGLSKNWSITEKILANKNISKEITFANFELDSTLLTRISNLQVDAAVIPITSYKNVFERQSQLSKFVINAVIGEEEIGNITLKKCNRKYKEIKTASLFADEFSAEYKWLIQKQKSTFGLKKLSYYEILSLMESEKLNCENGIIGSKRFLGNLKNADNFKFEKIGSIPLLLLIEEHFYKNRYNEIQNMKNFFLKESAQSGHFPKTFEELRKEVFDYNFSGTKFQLERLNEIVKPF